MNHLTINEAPPCEVAYFTEGSQTYARVTKEAFEQILTERRGAITMTKVWMSLAVIEVCMLAATTYWFTEHPVTKVVMVAPADIK